MIVNFQACHWPVYCVQAKNVDDAFNSCNEVLAEEPDNVDALCDRAETYINNEQYEEGISLNIGFMLHRLPIIALNILNYH